MHAIFQGFVSFRAYVSLSTPGCLVNRTHGQFLRITMETFGKETTKCGQWQMHHVAYI